MKAEKTSIYPIIKNNLNKISIVEYKKGQRFVASDKDLQEVFFIIEGVALVECTTRGGNKFLVDIVPENEFIGKISYIYEHNLKCDIFAKTNIKLFRFEKNVFEEFYLKPDFIALFHRKCTRRIYELYKTRMVRELFSCTEVIAYCISNKQENNVCNIKAIRNFSEIYSISRKSRYHSLLKLTEKEIVKKMGNTYEILNYDELHKLAFEVKEFLEKFNDEKLYVKVGMELFYGEGIEIIKMIKEMGHNIFLDLKLHDIPNTVKSAMKQLAKLEVDMVNVHASGSIAMMKAAIEGLEAGKTGDKRPLCIAVTCLTSLDQEVLDNELLINDTLENVVLKWATNAKEAGLDGVVCSPLESKVIHDNLGMEFITVTPGIRLADDSVNDQKRVTTPAMARELTSSYIVVGRTITGSADPYATYKKVYQDFQG